MKCGSRSKALREGATAFAQEWTRTEVRGSKVTRYVEERIVCEQCTEPDL